MSTTFPWYRFYSEAITDRKMVRICRDTGQPKALVIGVWATLLSLANDSPQRGKLLISDDIPLTAEDIIHETGLDEQTFDGLIQPFFDYGLVAVDGGCWSICHWDERQFDGDIPSTDRVRKHRQKLAETQKERRADNETNMKRFTNVSKVQKGHFGNVVDPDTDKEADTEGEKNARANVKPRPQPQNPPSPKMMISPSPQIEFSQDPEQRVAEAHMVRALADVTGMDGTLNIDKLLTVAQDLLSVNYTPEQVRAAYIRGAPPGRWSWYADDWRGKRGDMPTLKNIVETVGGAVKTTTAEKPEGGTLWLDHAKVFES